MAIDLKSYQASFLGRSLGVGLRERTPGDPHVIVEFLVEDDGCWNVMERGFSGYWLDDIEKPLAAAKEWMRTHCKPDGRHGWKFRGAARAQAVPQRFAPEPVDSPPPAPRRRTP